VKRKRKVEAMKQRRTWAGAMALVGATMVGASAQEPATLSLEEALELARQNNPTYLSARNDEAPASWRVRESYAAFLPTAQVDGSVGYQEGGSGRIGNFTAAELGVSETPAYYNSDYSAVLSMSLSGATFFNVAQQRANRRAVEANIRASELALEAAVKDAYLAVLRQRDNVELRRQQLERAEENLTLADARAQAGVAIPLDAKQARVERGRAQVAVLTAQSEFATSKLRLLQQLGVEIEADVTLTSDFQVFEPSWTRETVMQAALAAHPEVESLDATMRAQKAAARTAWSSYLPTFSARAILQGFTRQAGNDDFLLAEELTGLERALTNCQDFNDLNARLANPYPANDCSGYEATDLRVDSIRSAVIADNRDFPFSFSREPLRVSLGVSVPVFTGFTRQRQIAQAEAAADDTDQQLRSTRLRLRADVASAHLRVETAYQAVQIEETNRTLAAEQLEQARERYRVGLDSFIQLTEAETLKSEADQAYLAAVYTFHEALTDLEAAVGQPLRPEGR
jgi:outer membrane protein